MPVKTKTKQNGFEPPATLITISCPHLICSLIWQLLVENIGKEDGITGGDGVTTTSEAVIVDKGQEDVATGMQQTTIILEEEMERASLALLLRANSDQMLH